MNNENYFGVLTITHQDLEKLKLSNEKTKIKMIGTLTFSKGVSPELARKTIESIKVCSKTIASPKAKEVLNNLWSKERF